MCLIVFGESFRQETFERRDLMHRQSLLLGISTLFTIASFASASAGKEKMSKSTSMWEREVKHGITALAFSPDGKLVAQSAKGPKVHLFRAGDGKLLRTFVWGEKTVAICPVAFSPDGKILAAAQKQITLWDVAEGRPLQTIDAGDHVVSLAFSSEGRYLAGAGNGGVGIWRVADGKQIQSHKEEGAVWSVAFSPDGSLLASQAATGTIYLRQVKDGRLLQTLVGHTGFGPLAFSPDGKLLATSGGTDQTARLWNVAEGKLLFILTGHRGNVDSVKFVSLGNSLVTSSREGTLKVWRVADGGPIEEWDPTSRGKLAPRFFPVAVSPEGRSVAYGEGWIRVVVRGLSGLSSLNPQRQVSMSPQVTVR
jgi:WD40 repeat protein